MQLDAVSVLLGSLVPYAIVFTIRALKLIPGVIRDVTAAMWSVVKVKTA